MAQRVEHERGIQIEGSRRGGTRAEVSEHGMWQRVEKRKGGKRNGGQKGGRFYEVDAALVCDELAGFLVNLTRDLSLSLSLLLPHCSSIARSIPLSFFIIYREAIGLPIPHISS